MWEAVATNIAVTTSTNHEAFRELKTLKPTLACRSKALVRLFSPLCLCKVGWKSGTGIADKAAVEQLAKNAVVVWK